MSRFDPLKRGVISGSRDDEASPEVFVSPRVVDRVAFDEYAATLRGLLSEIRAESANLRSLLADCEATASKLRQVESRLESRVSSAPSRGPGR